MYNNGEGFAVSLNKHITDILMGMQRSEEYMC